MLRAMCAAVLYGICVVPAHATDLYAIAGPITTPSEVAFAQSVYASPYITGTLISASWSNLEPANGTFNWSVLDDQIALVPPNLAIELSIIGGADSPSWLSDLGVPELSFGFANHGGKDKVPCSPIAYPVPYSTGYISAHNAMMDAVAAHLASTGTLGQIAAIKVNNFGVITEELRVPLACTGAGTIETKGQAIATWKAAAYTPSAVIAAWTAMAAEDALDFPNAVLSLDVLAGEGVSFPPLDNNSRKTKTPVAVVQSIIDAGVSAYPGRFKVQWDGLSTNPIPAMEVLAQCGNPNAAVAWQSNEWASQQAGCGAGPGSAACTDSQYLTLLQNGQTQCGSSIEIFGLDVINHAAALSQFTSGTGALRRK